MSSVSKYTLRSLIVVILYVFFVIGMMFRPVQNISVFQNIFIVFSSGIMASLVAAPRFFRTRIFLFFAVYALVMMFNYFMEPSVNLGNILSESSTVFFSSCLAYYLLNYHESKSLSPVLMWLFFVITGVYTIMTLVFYQTSPGIMRSAAMSYNQDIYEPYFRAGLSTYQFPHAISCLIPAYVLGLKGKVLPRKKILAVVMLVGSLLLIYITQATGALIVASVALLLSVISKIGRSRRNTQTIIIITVLFLPLLFSSYIQSGLLDLVSDIVGTSSHYTSKIEELQSSIDNVYSEGGDIQTRKYLLGKTINAIIEHPIIGVSDRSYGNHNALLDRWAEYGLIGLLPLLLGLIMIIKMTAKTIPFDIKFFYIIGISASFIMILSKNMFGWDQWFCSLVMLPILIKYFGIESYNIKGYE